MSNVPYGLKWRSSYWYATFVVGLGIATDWIVYSILVPVLPFQLQKLGYKSPSVLTSWLLFAYCAGLVVSTLPVAMVSERYNTRSAPLITGVFVLIGSQIMLMEAPVYWLMVLARVLQGTGSAMIWVVGPALLCDTTPASLIGRQLAVAMTGQAIGLLVGPAVGGVLYGGFGFRGPCIFGITTAVCDLLSRFILIDRQAALRYGYDPAYEPNPNEPEAHALQGSQTASDNTLQHKAEDSTQNSSQSLIVVVVQFSKSSRGIATTFLTCLYSALIMSVEPTLPLKLQDSWGFNSTKVGLVFLAAVVPTFASGPLAGHISDRYGTSFIALVSYVASVPWWALMIVDNLPLLILAFALTRFCASGIVSPLMAEMAAVSRAIDGVGYAHVYAAFCMAFGIGCAVGPVVGGEIYDKLKQGWMIQCLVGIGMLGAGFIISFFYVGEKPAFNHLVILVRRKRSTQD